MEYTIHKLSRLAGVTPRTLRYYDEIGLLSPARKNSSNYRIYGQKEVDALQQILFFKELGFDLDTIARVMKDSSFNRLEALYHHLEELEQKKRNMELLIANIKKTIHQEERGIQMTDKEKFEGLKKNLVKENEDTYGREVANAYGKEVLEETGKKVLSLSKMEFEEMKKLEAEIKDLLHKAVRDGQSPKGDAGRTVAKLHRSWLMYTWNQYTPDIHRELARLYVSDSRFTQYYDKELKGCAEFLKDAVLEHIDAGI